MARSEPPLSVSKMPWDEVEEELLEALTLDLDEAAEPWDYDEKLPSERGQSAVTSVPTPRSVKSSAMTE